MHRRRYGRVAFGLATSAESWRSESALVKRELAGRVITASEAATVDFWNLWLERTTLGVFAVALALYALWAIRALRNARMLTRTKRRFNRALFLLPGLWVHLLFGHLWLAGTPELEKLQGRRRILWDVWSILLLVCTAWHAMSPLPTLSQSITDPQLRAEGVPFVRQRQVELLLTPCKERLVASYLHMFAAVLLAFGVVWIDRLHARKWDALTGKNAESFTT